MEKVKTLNTMQRRMLASIYERKMSNVVDSESRKFNSTEALDKLTQEAVKGDEVIAKALKDYNKGEELIGEASKILRTNKIEVEPQYHSYPTRKKPRLYYDHPARIAYDKANTEKVAKLKEARDQILAEIWGIEGSYDEVVKRIDQLVKEALA